MTEHQLKYQFAKMLLGGVEPFKAALKLFPDNTNRALRIANEWPVDIEVEQLTDKIIAEEGEEQFLPNRAELARSVWDRMHHQFTMIEDFTKLGKLYADVMGFIQKPTVTVNTQNNTRSVKVDIENVNTVAQAEQIYKEMISSIDDE